MESKLRLLGTGTSQGIPVIGCDCAICNSSDTKDKRLRSSALYSQGGINIMIDVGPDSRQQLLSAGIKNLDAILLTHEHNDHVIGLDEIRPFNHRQNMNIPVYGLKRVLGEISKRFPYVLDINPYPGAPKITPIEIEPFKSFFIKDIEILPLLVYHGNLEILGFKLGGLGYVTDAKTIPQDSVKHLNKIPNLVINALHHQPHKMHFNLEECLLFIESIQPEKAFLTHMSHKMGFHHLMPDLLPDFVKPGYDGLEFFV